jgi:hypothetical protein
MGPIPGMESIQPFPEGDFISKGIFIAAKAESQEKPAQKKFQGNFCYESNRLHGNVKERGIHDIITVGEDYIGEIIYILNDRDNRNNHYYRECFTPFKTFFFEELEYLDNCQNEILC